MRTAALSLIYSTADYCAPAWCHRAYTRLIDSVLNDALRIVTGCLCPTPTDNLLVLSGIHTVELRCQGATLSLANRSSLDPGHILHGQLSKQHAASKERLKSRNSFVSAARKLLHNLSELGFRAAQWTNLTWDTEHSKSMSALGVYISRVSTRLIGMSLTRTAWVKLNRWALVLGVSVCSCTNGVSLLQRNSSVALEKNCRPHYFSMSHTSGTSRNNGSDSFG